MLKRFIVPIFLIITLIGCSSSPNASNDTGSDSEEKEIELSFPTWQAQEPGFSEWWTGLIEEYEQEHSNVKINMNQIPFSEYVDQLTIQFSAGTPPDIVHLPSRNFSQFADQGWLRPLDDYLEPTNIPDNWTKLQENMIWDDQTQGVLLMGYGFVLFYNEQLLQNAGLSVPETPEELVNAAKTLTKDGTYGFGLTTTEHPNVYSDASIFLIGNEQQWATDSNYDLTNPEIIETIDIYRELLEYSPKGISSEQKRQLFFDGKVAMMLDGPFVLALKDEATEAVKPHVKVTKAPFPVNPGAVSNSLHIPANIDPDKEKLVWEFIELAASPKWQDKYAELTNSVPPRANAVTSETIENNPEMELFSDVATEAVSIDPSSENILANYNEFQKIITESMMELMTSDNPTTEVMTKLQNELEDKIKP